MSVFLQQAELSQLVDLLEKHSSNLPDKVNIELEAKFGTHNKGKFESNVPFVHYERLLKKLRDNYKNEKIQESHVEQQGSIRRLTTTNIGEELETEQWQKKTLIHNFDSPQLQEYDLRLSLNEEEELPETTEFQPGEVVIRERTRHSFIIRPNTVRVDMTEVMMNIKGVFSQKYEVEVEFIGKINQIEEFFEDIMLISKLLKGTRRIYTNSQKEKLFRDYNQILGPHPLVQARNIKSRDLVWGGIVGNPQTDYLITFKADGLRKLLFIHSSGIWLIYPPFEYNLIFSLEDVVDEAKGGLLKKIFQYLNGTILDGELVDPKIGETPKATYRYLAFDCLSFRYDDRKPFSYSEIQNIVKIQNQPYLKRLEKVTLISQRISSPILNIDQKETKLIESPEQFFYLVNYFLDKRSSLDYYQDGLIIVPNKVPYNPGSHLRPLYERTLTRLPDICKWKESEDITIDFSIKRIPPEQPFRLQLQSYSSKEKSLVPFLGSKNHPFDPQNIDHEHELTRNLPRNTVVEYEWIITDENTREGYFRPRRIRHDKRGPNQLEIAEDDWDDIINPVTEKDIRGNTLSLTFAYHNRLKRELFNNLSKGSTLLDIGSGRGGDIRKWSSFSQIISVEPNENNRQELIRRLHQNGMTDKVFILPTGGENTLAITKSVREIIPDQKVDAVSLMLSLSFFWASSQYLDGLINTIIHNLKPGGKILFLTIDGDSVEQLMEPPLSPISSHKSELDLSTAHLSLYMRPNKLSFGRALDFNLPNTIVGEQREYLVHLDDFIQRLSVHGFSVQSIRRAEGEKLLPLSNQIYTSLYTYGVIENTDPVLFSSHQQQLKLANLMFPPIPPPVKAPRTNPLSPRTNPLSPTKMLSPIKVLSPPKMLSPTKPLSPPKMLSPTKPLSPPKMLSPIKPLSPTKMLSPPKLLSPNKMLSPPKLLSPTKPLSPPKVLSPTNTLSPQIKPLSPMIKPLSPPKMLSPRRDEELTTNPLSPTKLLSPRREEEVFTSIKQKDKEIKIKNRRQIETNQLPRIEVNHMAGNKIINGPAKNDDTYLPLKCSWHENLIRIATIGDGNCFIHSVLKAMYDVYQENNNAQYRIQLAQVIRRDLASALYKENPLYPGKTYWATTGKGAFPRLLMQELESESNTQPPEQNILELFRVDYGLSGLQRLFNSTTYLGDEIYEFVADVLEIDVYILRATNDDLYPHIHTHKSGVNRKAIVIVGNNTHYEVVAVNKEEGFQTIFAPDDEFIEILNQVFIGDEDLGDAYNTMKYDPDEVFIKDAVESFGSTGELKIPADFSKVFMEDDPFLTTFNRLLPQIEMMTSSR